MKRKKENKDLVPVKEQPMQVNVEDSNVNVNVSVLAQLFKGLQGVIQVFIHESGERMEFSSYDDIQENSKIINGIKFLMTFFNPALIEFLENENNRLKLKLDIESLAKTKGRKSIEQASFHDPEVQATINCGIKVSGLIFGNIAGNLKNKEGSLLIEVDNRALANILASNFKLINGKALNPDSLAVYIGQGRKMESIFNPDALEELFNKIR